MYSWCISTCGKQLKRRSIIAVPERPEETTKNGLVGTPIRSGSLRARDDDGFAADAGFRERAVELAADVAQASLFQSEIEVLATGVAFAAERVIADVVVAHQEEELHREARQRFDHIEADALEQSFE